jgi:hypothetical protein
MRLMMTLIADTAQDVDAISAYLASESLNLLGSEQLLDEGATITEHGDAPAVVEPMSLCCEPRGIFNVVLRLS